MRCVLPIPLNETTTSPEDTTACTAVGAAGLVRGVTNAVMAAGPLPFELVATTAKL